MDIIVEDNGKCIDGLPHQMQYSYSEGSSDVYECMKKGCKAIYVVHDALGR